MKMIRQGIKGYHEIRDGKKVYIRLGPDRKYLTEREYNTLDESIKPWFSFDIVESWYYGRKKYSVYIPEHWLMLKVRPHIITHYCEKDFELESEYAFVESKLERYKTYGHCNKNFNSTGRKRVEQRIAIQKFMKGITEDVEIGRADPPHW